MLSDGGFKMVERIKDCATILKNHGRKMVLDLLPYDEVEYMQRNPISEKAYFVKYCCKLGGI